jgi:DNA polymerase
VSLQLDARQRAMLEEIGVRMFWPDAAGDAPAVPTPAVRQAAVPAQEPPAPAPARRELVRAEIAPVAPAAPADLDVSAMDWDQLQQAVAGWAAARGRRPVFGTGDLRPDWLCIGEPPGEDEEREGLPFTGDAGRLLDNMLLAVGASRRKGAYVTSVLKCRLAQDRAGEAEDIAQSLAFLQRQVALLQPRVILAMGRFAVQALLQNNEPPGRLRGQVHRYEGVPLVVTFHPASLLRTPAEKARAWADLCLARSLVQAPA